MRAALITILLLYTPVVFGQGETYPDKMLQAKELLQSPTSTGTISGKENIQLHYSVFEPTEVKASAVLINGRTITYLQYGELIWDFFSRGYRVYVYDHRGQGLSERLFKELPEMGHVDSYEDYADDFLTFMEKVVMADQHTKLFVKATSMGGMITALALSRGNLPFKVDALALVAPMIDIKFPVPKWLVSLKLWFNSPLEYALSSNGVYRPIPFEENKVTTSPERYASLQKVKREQPVTRLGGPSTGWVKASMEAHETLMTRVRNQAQSKTAPLSMPVLLLQAKDESFVDNDAQREFCQLLNQGGGSCTMEKIDGKHGLMVEQDQLRTKALDLVLRHFRSSEQP